MSGLPLSHMQSKVKGKKAELIADRIDTSHTWRACRNLCALPLGSKASCSFFVTQEVKKKNKAKKLTANFGSASQHFKWNRSPASHCKSGKIEKLFKSQIFASLVEFCVGC